MVERLVPSTAAQVEPVPMDRAANAERVAVEGEVKTAGLVERVETVVLPVAAAVVAVQALPQAEREDAVRVAKSESGTGEQCESH